MSDFGLSFARRGSTYIPHFDDLAGKVAVESDRDMRGDMREALETVLRHTYISIHTYLNWVSLCTCIVCIYVVSSC